MRKKQAITMIICMLIGGTIKGSYNKIELPPRVFYPDGIEQTPSPGYMKICLPLLFAYFMYVNHKEACSMQEDEDTDSCHQIVSNKNCVCCRPNQTAPLNDQTKS